MVRAALSLMCRVVGCVLSADDGIEAAAWRLLDCGDGVDDASIVEQLFDQLPVWFCDYLYLL